MVFRYNPVLLPANIFLYITVSSCYANLIILTSVPIYILVKYCLKCFLYSIIFNVHFTVLYQFHCITVLYQFAFLFISLTPGSLGGKETCRKSLGYWRDAEQGDISDSRMIPISLIQGVFFNWPPPKKLEYKILVLREFRGGPVLDLVRFLNRSKCYWPPPKKLEYEILELREFRGGPVLDLVKFLNWSKLYWPPP